MRYVPTKTRSNYYPMMSAFDKFFDNFFEEDKAVENVRMMNIDLLEKDDQYEIKADLPGFEKEDVNISLDKNNLVIEANHTEDKEDREETYYRCERYSGNYRRTIALTEKCDAKNIQADFKNGVLKVKIPKMEPEPATKIAIS